MKGKIISVLLVLTFVYNLSADYEAYIHNCTGYKMTGSIYFKGICKHLSDKSFSKGSVTKVNWSGACPRISSMNFNVTLGNNDVKKVLDSQETTGKMPRHFYIFAEAPIIQQRGTGTSIGIIGEGTPYVRFFLWVTPKAQRSGGLYAISQWYDTVTGKIVPLEEAKKAGLDIEQAETVKGDPED